MADHAPKRPSWGCLSRERPWPCGPAREELIGEKERMPVAVYMWERLEEAVMELPPTPVAEIFERFIKWTR